MTEKDKFKITIKVADIQDFSLTIRRDEEVYYRRAIEQVNQLWMTYVKNNVDGNNTQRILAVISLMVTKQMFEMQTKVRDYEGRRLKQQNEIADMLSGFEQELDKILMNLPEDEKK